MKLKNLILKKLKAQMIQQLELSKIQIINLVLLLQKIKKKEKVSMGKNGFLIKEICCEYFFIN